MVTKFGNTPWEEGLWEGGKVEQQQACCSVWVSACGACARGSGMCAAEKDKCDTHDNTCVLVLKIMMGWQVKCK